MSANEASPDDLSKQTPSALARSTGTVSKWLRRPTRSSAKDRKEAGNDSDLEPAIRKAKPSESGALGTPWKKPLVFPKTGKKKESVDFLDLPRLDPGEFLNDNLIGFYLRYLEHFLEEHNPEVAKKVHFFNSYFYERLTKPEKGTKAINYAAVQKWTRNIDIFSRDFVVVPVNENLHWYVAIICNLPYLRRKLADDEDEDHEEAVEELQPPIPTEAVSATPTGEINGNLEVLDEPTGKTSSSFAELPLGDAEKAAPVDDDVPIVQSDVIPQSPAKPKKAPGRRKSVRRSLNKIDPAKPVVITLDSLDLSRSATRTTLKDYIVEEGKAKRSLELERVSLDGVTAKGIPTQKNDSDCGLFVCAYMERFVLDPYRFVRDILQRDMDDAKDWPMYSSDDLRSRLCKLILELHREQEGEKSEKPIPDVGQILLQRPRPAASEPDVEPKFQGFHETAAEQSKGHEDETASSQVNAELIAIASITGQAASSPELSPGTQYRSAVDAVNRPSPEKSRMATRRTPQPPIVILDDTPSSHEPRHLSSNLQSPSQLSDDFISGPHELAHRTKQERSPPVSRSQGPPEGRNSRFLPGTESAADQVEFNMIEESEIPETQFQALNRDRRSEEQGDVPQEILPGV